MGLSLTRMCLVLLWSGVLQLASASQCAVGDAACFCILIKGTWVATPSTIRPTCRKTVDSQGNCLNAQTMESSADTVTASGPATLAVATAPNRRHPAAWQL
jgi:hypothetical protein